ncbi:LolA family protein [Natronosporangium hydrolyticum]|uniref:LolA family protein n=1 Tax=Natronosporangium hydrolyticum TaxID=2811111 RepID=UPI001EFA1D25|nr:outer membrane lipoprotein carrier protein LolA [Natronosporangium hydrolyticum]
MSVWSRRPALRWLVPATATAMVIGGGAAANAIAATEPELPPRSATELLVDLQTAEVDGFSGTVVQTIDLGLPGLPETAGHGSADLGTLWSGSNTLRVWYGSPDQLRIALLGTLGQSDIIVDGEDLWIWESRENQASHRQLPPFGEAGGPQDTTPGLTPQAAAEAVLAFLDPTTEVTTGGTAEVAGRAAYELVLSPRDDESLFREVRIAIDAEHSVPLAVRVFGAAADPAVEVQFTHLSFERPDPEQFRFNPPPDATVTEAELLPWGPVTGHEGHEGQPWPAATVVGEGWASVLVLAVPEAKLDQDELAWLLAGLPTVSGEWGSGQLLTGDLFSALLTDDDRFLIGAVPPERLVAVADDPAAALPDQPSPESSGEPESQGEDE